MAIKTVLSVLAVVSTCALAPLRASAATMAPPFSVTVKNYSGGRIEIVAIPPEKHHFNIYAPLTVEDLDRKTHQRAMQIREKYVQFLISRGSGVRNLAVSIYMCDDAKTFCEKHRVVTKFPPDGDKAAAQPAPVVPDAAVTQEPAKSKVAPAGEKPLSAFQIASHGVIRYVRTDANGFIDNDIDGAFTKAQSDSRPILIDFYGIWCPPCNDLQDEVFTSADFKNAAAGMVKLKIDADAENSWTLKTRYHVGGYPTVILVTAEGEEIGRIVGGMSRKDFLKNLQAMWDVRNEPYSKTKQKAEAGDVAAARRLGSIHLARGEFKEAERYLAKAGAAASAPVTAPAPAVAAVSAPVATPSAAATPAPQPAVAPVAAKVEPNPDQELLYEAQIGLLKQAIAEKAPGSDDAKAEEAKLRDLLEHSLADFPNTVSALERRESVAKLYEDTKDEAKRQEHLKLLVAFAKDLRAHPEKLAGTLYTRADVAQALAEAYEAMPNAKLAKAAWKAAANEYARGPNAPRGQALERAYCLWKSGQTVTAEQVYRLMQKKYPSEFTFYYSHAQMLYEIKRYARARELAAKALNYSYGDNKLRTVLLLAKTYAALGRPQEGLSIIASTLSTMQVPSDQKVRTHRYVKQLKELEEKLKATQAKS